MTTEVLERSATTSTTSTAVAVTTSLEAAAGDVIATAERVAARVPFPAPKFASGATRPTAPAGEIVYPPAGTWVQVTVTGTTGTFRGRLVSVDDDVVVLREGAGYWHIEPATVTGVRTVNRGHRQPVVVDPKTQARRCEQQAERILERWP